MLRAAAGGCYPDSMRAWVLVLATVLAAACAPSTPQLQRRELPVQHVPRGHGAPGRNSGSGGGRRPASGTLPAGGNGGHVPSRVPLRHRALHRAAVVSSDIARPGPSLRVEPNVAGGGAGDPSRPTRGRLDQGPGDHGARVPAAAPYGRHRRRRMAVLPLARLRGPRPFHRRDDRVGATGAGAAVITGSPSPSVS